MTYLIKTVLWKKLYKYNHDRVGALTAIHEGFQVKVIEITPNMKFTQKRAVEAKNLRPEVHKMMQDVIDVVYIIKIRPLIYNKILTGFCNKHIEV